MNTFNILIAGAAGSGIEAVSHLLALYFTRESLFVHTHSEYENRIRGGSNYSQVRVSSSKVVSHSDGVDIAIIMDKNSLQEHIPKIQEGGVLIYDADKIDIEQFKIPQSLQLVSLPSALIAKEIGLALCSNIVFVGSVFALMGRKHENFLSVLETQFQKKGEKIVHMNQQAFKKGAEYTMQNYKTKVLCDFIGDKTQRSLLFGNEAIALGCIKAGMKFLAAYPMTPGSTIMTVLAKESRNYNIVVSHTEDEIAAVNMAIGAGATGIRAATSTSGGGFALMGEALSFAGMIESPVVIFNAQRPGPSTGLPTQTAQSDLRMAMHSGQGDFPKLVMAIGDVEEAVTLSFEAFNYAEKYQIPVIVLTEKYIADSYVSVDMNITETLNIERGKMIFDEKDLPKEILKDSRFPRYKDSPDGVSVRPIFGLKGGEHIVNSYEHDAYGNIIEAVEDVKIPIDKRWRKIQTLKEALPSPKLYSLSNNSKVVIILFGGTKGPALDAQLLLQQDSINIDIIQIQFIYPLKSEALQSLCNKYDKIICIEGNQSGQLEGVLKEYADITADFSIRNFYGRPFTGDMIYEKCKQFCL
jgi:2-oxoglutarate/2-oxoacid ferredoxin oxidoreductase subunit alpha